ncbi:hypothetical protein ABMB67_003376 [Halalkalibacter oceani]
MRINQEKAIEDVQLFQQITGPNVHSAGYQISDSGLLRGTITFKRYKEVDGIPMDWGDDVVSYSLFGGLRRIRGTVSSIQLPDPVTGQRRAYDPDSKQRIMEFYRPDVFDYEEIKNDLALLPQLDPDSSAEMALSFDSGYSVEEASAMIPDSVSLKWFWVDTYSENDTQHHNGIILPSFPNSANEVYGFPNDANNPSASAKQFIDALNLGYEKSNGRYHREFKRIFHYITKDSETVNVEDIEIFGVVVTGSADELASLAELQQVRASSLGVMNKGYNGKDDL